MVTRLLRVRRLSERLLPSRGEADGTGDGSGPPPSVAQHCFEFQSRRVLSLLTEHGGDVWQTEIAATTGWSQSKTSRVLSRMESDGTIDRYRFGRHKVVCLPDRDPADLTKPTVE